MFASYFQSIFQLKATKGYRQFQHLWPRYIYIISDILLALHLLWFLFMHKQRPSHTHANKMQNTAMPLLYIIDVIILFISKGRLPLITAAIDRLFCFLVILCADRSYF